MNLFNYRSISYVHRLKFLWQEIIKIVSFFMLNMIAVFVRIGKKKTYL
jgi:hypothetical protein